MCIPSLRDYHKKTFYTAYSRKILRFYKTLENRRDGARTASTTRQKDKKEYASALRLRSVTERSPANAQRPKETQNGFFFKKKKTVCFLSHMYAFIIFAHSIDKPT
jgi:hypothetical protein